MCELLGMSANVPTDICFSFSGLIKRGGGTGPHRDGWGIAFYQGRGIREFRDPQPGFNSEIAKFIKDFPIKSTVVISHIRQANVGKVSLENTHPYIRELEGRYWCYAHNGQLKDLDRLIGSSDKRFLPVGDTDSEAAFCWLMGVLAKSGEQSLDARQKTIHSCANQLAKLGVFNMLLSDGDRLYVYCSTKLHWITRRAPFGVATLQDDDISVNFGEETTVNDIVTMIATEPLTTNETWVKMQPGELAVFEKGELVVQA
ncbi:class II glutamine amidotransferase [Alkalimarinus sediminis]|uniref:Class II glutamine amidotransferase n=1 Tax=Alkalimarinus sediminis TaxID=1632866 RepID=A0A9E8HKH6_9ALTE|nr:class II glutamine amidotransferase [Alkalimarinus sediminis]UZW76000.1 class II glutamine amidotransferase [Alkalimarinus sediminis]